MKKQNDIDYDWITSLAKNSASNDVNRIASKEDRKRKRQEKKNRRQILQQSILLSKPSKQQTSTAIPQVHEASSSSAASVMVEISTTRIRCLSKNLQIIRKEIHDNNNTREGSIANIAAATTATSTSIRRRRQKWKFFQPKKSNYSGIGVARNSMYIEFIDPSYYPKLEEEFNEHIVGFYGKQRTKAMKKQMNGNMLWKRLLDTKEKNNTLSKKRKLSPDERIKALLVNSRLM